MAVHNIRHNFQPEFHTTSSLSLYTPLYIQTRMCANSFPGSYHMWCCCTMLHKTDALLQQCMCVLQDGKTHKLYTSDIWWGGVLIMESILWWCSSLWHLHHEYQSCIYALWGACVVVVTISVMSPWSMPILYLCIMESMCCDSHHLCDISMTSISPVFMHYGGMCCDSHHLCNVSMINFSSASIHYREYMLWSSSL